MCLILYGAFSVFLPLSLKPWKIMEGIWSSVHYRFWNLELQPWKQEVCGVTLFYFDMGPLLTWGESFWGETYELDSLPTIPSKQTYPVSPPSKWQDSWASSLLLGPNHRNPTCAGQHLKDFLAIFSVLPWLPWLQASYFWLWWKSEGRNVILKAIRAKKAFLEASYLPPLSIREAIKLFHFSSPLGGEQQGH